MSYTPSRGPLAGRPFKSYYAYRNARAIHAGYKSYADSKKQRTLPAPDGVCWEYQANELPIRLSFSIKVF